MKHIQLAELEYRTLLARYKASVLFPRSVPYEYTKALEAEILRRLEVGSIPHE